MQSNLPSSEELINQFMRMLREQPKNYVDNLALLAAQLNKDNEKIKEIIKNNPEILLHKAPMGKQFNLMQLLERDDIEMLELCFEALSEIDRSNLFFEEKNGYDMNLLHLAIAAKKYDATKFLIKKFPDFLNQTDNIDGLRLSPIYLAIGIGDIKLLEVIYESVKEIGQERVFHDKVGDCYPIIYAIREAQPNAVKWLIEKDVSVNFTSDSSKPLLQQTLALMKHNVELKEKKSEKDHEAWKEIAIFLAQNGADVNIVENGQPQALICVLEMLDIDLTFAFIPYSNADTLGVYYNIMKQSCEVDAIDTVATMVRPFFDELSPEIGLEDYALRQEQNGDMHGILGRLYIGENE